MSDPRVRAAALATNRFPTRTYPYRRREANGLALAVDPPATLADAGFVRFRIGRDASPVPIADADVLTHVNDPFAALVLAPGRRPQTLLDLLAALDAGTGAQAVPGQRVYRVADGGQIAWGDAPADLDRHLRLVVTRHRGEDAELFIATAPPFASPAIFLQVFAWDPALGAYNYYQRHRGTWVWAGSSWDALAPDTQGNGPFDGHVAGGPVMKELKQPWLHWHSQAAAIRDDILAPDDPLRTDALYQDGSPRGLRGCEDLELLVRAGIARWTRSRVDALTADGRLRDAPAFLGHLLVTNTTNLVSSGERSAVLGAGDVVRLPTTFFLDADLLIDDLALPATLPRLKAPADLYRACLDRYGVRLHDGTTTLARDAFFAFAVPERALEDRAVVQELLRRGALSRRLAATLLMVDFPNPVFSERRAALMAHAPDMLPLDGGNALDRAMPDAIRARAASADPASPEAEFLVLWDLPDDGWADTFARRIEAYWRALAAAIATPDGFDAVFRLAESRRRVFRGRPLAEFGLTLPVATLLDIPHPLRMSEDARVAA